MPISRVRSRIMVCMFIRTTRKLMTMPRPTMVLMKGFSSGDWRSSLARRIRTWSGCDFCGSSSGFRRGRLRVALAADENHGNVIFRSDDVCPVFKGMKKRAPFAVGNDAEMVKE